MSITAKQESKSGMNWKQKSILIGGASILLLMAGLWIKPYVIADWVPGTVKKTYVKRTQGHDDTYLVDVKVDGTDFVDTFQNTDCVWRFKWNSGTVQANIEEGTHYNFKVLGRRNYFTSAYRNIMKVEKK